MIVYKLDNTTHADANTQIKDMVKVLSEISPTLQILNQVLSQHEQAISSPSINEYRSELKHMVANANVLAKNISENTQRLAAVSDQASKHLANIDAHMNEALGKTQPTNQVSGRNQPTQPVSRFSA